MPWNNSNFLFSLLIKKFIETGMDGTSKYEKKNSMNTFREGQEEEKIPREKKTK